MPNYPDFISKYSITHLRELEAEAIYVICPQRDEYHDYRGYAGRIAGGVWKPGEKGFLAPGGSISLHAH